MISRPKNEVPGSGATRPQAAALADMLSTAIKAQHVPIEGLAKAIGVKSRTFRRWKTDGHVPLEAVAKVAAECGLPEADLLRSCLLARLEDKGAAPLGSLDRLVRERNVPDQPRFFRITLRCVDAPGIIGAFGEAMRMSGLTIIKIDQAVDEFEDPKLAVVSAFLQELKPNQTRQAGDLVRQVERYLSANVAKIIASVSGHDQVEPKLSVTSFDQTEATGPIAIDLNLSSPK